MLLEELRAGAAGTMTGFGYPEILVDIVRRWFAGDADGASDVFYRAHAAHPLREPGRSSTCPSARRSTAGAGPSPRHASERPAARSIPGTVADLDDLLARLELPSPTS